VSFTCAYVEDIAKYYLRQAKISRDAAVLADADDVRTRERCWKLNAELLAKAKALQTAATILKDHQ